MKKRIIAIITASILILAAISVPFAATEFSDMKDHWAKANVENLRSKGIIDGYEDGTFKPENTVTYGEFIKMLVVAVTGENPGVSIDGSHWASGYYKAALENNLLKKEDIPLLLSMLGVNEQNRSEGRFVVLYKSDCEKIYTIAADCKE